jgi:hypothetical protein
MSFRVFGVCACCIFATLFLASCSTMMNARQSRVYKIHKRIEPIAIDANWDKPQWQRIKPLNIKLFMGDKPQHLPKTQAKLLYDDDNIYVIFRVEDRFIRALATEYHGSVWQDSCVEFFFTPDLDISEGYFNIETNCIGTILCSHQIKRGQKQQKLTVQQLDQIEIATSLPQQVIEPEIKEPVTWTLEYRLPLKILKDYCNLTKPAPGVKWRANFYKCADNTTQPHWLTWSYIDKPQPDFHRPEYFGTLEFLD